jgi:hypothetical protein
MALLSRNAGKRGLGHFCWSVGLIISQENLQVVSPCVRAFQPLLRPENFGLTQGDDFLCGSDFGTERGYKIVCHEGSLVAWESGVNSARLQASDLGDTDLSAARRPLHTIH